MTKIYNLFIRILARAVDGVLFTFFLLAVFKLANIDFELLGGVVFALVFMLAWVTLEGLLMAYVGTTPGKWLMRVEVRTIKGQSLTKADAFRRSLGLLIIGNAFGLPYLIVVAWLANLVKFLASCATFYDQWGKFKVVQNRVGAIRLVVVIVALAVVIVVGILGDAEPDNPRVQYIPIRARHHIVPLDWLFNK